MPTTRKSASAPRATLLKVNAAIKAAGGNDELIRGDGYFYFAGGDAAQWPSSSVTVSHIGAFTVAEWMEERRVLRRAWLDWAPEREFHEPLISIAKGDKP